MKETTIKGFGNNAGIVVPSRSLDELGVGKRPPVEVIIGSYSYKSTVGAMSGLYLISLSKAHREASGLSVGNKITVTLRLDEGVREVEVASYLKKVLIKEKLYKTFSMLAYSKRKEFVRQVIEAKTEETRERRISKIVYTLGHTQNK